MSENEQTGHDGAEQPPTSGRPAAPEQRERAVVRQEQPVPPGDRLARIGHIEHHAEPYVIMQTIPNPLPAPDDAVEWAHSFARGGADKKITAVDVDPQSTVNHEEANWL
ncbi:hypothetical protein AB0K86_19930 [Streptomyces clavifer]|uniref:hypothetical protein n=1 Tax=Streptomyces clavifer TaxID=68188 RepID=UPI0034305C50